MMIALSGVASVAFAETDASVSTTETLAALSAVPGVLSASKDITPISSVEAVAVVRQSGTTVTVYRDPSAGVRVSQQGGSSAVHVPRAGHEQPALVAPGVAAYPGTASSSTAVQTLKDGGVRLLTVMTSSAAAETYGYPVSVDGGGSVIVNSDGSAAIVSDAGNVITQIQAPWAVDSRGAKVPTYYETDGKTLTQHIAHHSGGYEYPIVADPVFWDYVLCITGTGVPVGLAWYLAAELGSMTAIKAIISGTKGMPPGFPRIYATKIYNACWRFLRS